ncbi:MAG TPA: pilus assembly PilX N-terminal domain-containing protein [Burkholderiaceae bacterium]|nr:pilus assembly PilX N-terminal domain-containing protein [Burkholderiaceae bacterium]
MNPSRRASVAKAQAGATLLVSMVFLVMLTLIVISAMKMTNVNTKVAANLQTQQEANAAATQGIETTISSDFTAMPTANPMTVDINDSGQAGSAYSVNVEAPKCTYIKPVKLSELDPANTDDQPCYASGAAQNTGIVGSGGSGNSLCSNSNWDVAATAKAPTSAASSATTHQGIAVRVAVGAAC